MGRGTVLIARNEAPNSNTLSASERQVWRAVACAVRSRSCRDVPCATVWVCYMLHVQGLLFPETLCGGGEKYFLSSKFIFLSPLSFTLSKTRGEHVTCNNNNDNDQQQQQRAFFTACFFHSVLFSQRLCMPRDTKPVGFGETLLASCRCCCCCYMLHVHPLFFERDRGEEARSYF